MKKSEIIEKLKKLTSLDAYDVNGKYTPIPHDIETKGNIISVAWMNRDEGVPHTKMYDLSEPQELEKLQETISLVIDDLIDEIKPEFLENVQSDHTEFYITEARFENKVRRENIFKISNYADLKKYLHKNLKINPENYRIKKTERQFLVEGEKVFRAYIFMQDGTKVFLHYDFDVTLPDSEKKLDVLEQHLPKDKFYRGVRWFWANMKLFENQFQIQEKGTELVWRAAFYGDSENYVVENSKNKERFVYFNGKLHHISEEYMNEKGEDRDDLEPAPEDYFVFGLDTSVNRDGASLYTRVNHDKVLFSEYGRVIFDNHMVLNSLCYYKPKCKKISENLSGEVEEYDCLMIAEDCYCIGKDKIYKFTYHSHTNRFRAVRCFNGDGGRVLNYSADEKKFPAIESFVIENSKA